MSEDPQFRSRPGVPADRRVYPIAVHNQVEFKPNPEQKEVVEDTKPTPCYRCGVPMLRRDIFGTFDGNPVCKVCYLDLERSENEGTIDEDYANNPSADEEIAQRKAEEKAAKKAEQPDKKEDDSGPLGGFLGI